MALALITAGGLLYLDNNSADGSSADRAGNVLAGGPGSTSSGSTTPGQPSGSASASAQPSASATKTPGPRSTTTTPGRTGTVVPPPAGFPNASNTGFRHAPGFPGTLTKFSGSIKSNTTYKFYEFPTGLRIPEGIVNVTFLGCRFTSNATVDANVANYGDNITFSYSSFEPPGPIGSPKTVPYNTSYQYGIDQRKPTKMTVDHSDFWGWGNAIQFGWSTQAKPLTIKDSWFHHARTDGGVDHTDAILESYGGPSYMVIDHNTIVSDGNTNGLALQGDGYSNVSVTRNYFSGFGYTVNVGAHGDGNRNVLFSGNVFGTDIEPGWGPLYGWRNGNGNLWRENKWRVAPGGYSSKTADDGKYWWPDGTLSTSDFTG